MMRPGVGIEGADRMSVHAMIFFHLPFAFDVFSAALRAKRNSNCWRVTMSLGAVKSGTKDATIRECSTDYRSLYAGIIMDNLLQFTWSDCMRM